MTPGLWGITTYFNPGKSAIRLENYRRFRGNSQRQSLPLVAVELAFGEQPFELQPGVDAEVVLQRRSTSVLWQKERLLNLGLAALPKECTSVCWIDADILFEDDDWVAQSAALLKHAAVIQPFSVAIRLPPGGAVAEFPSSQVGHGIARGRDDGTYSDALCAKWRGWFSRFSGTTGYVWCAQRDLIDECGFYDRCIVGGGDREFALAVCFAPGKIPPKHTLSHHVPLREHLRLWHERLHARVSGRIAFRRGAVHHLWHADTKHRAYEDRHAILQRHDFRPDRDLSLDAGGCWQWNTANQALIDAVSAYFAARNES